MSSEINFLSPETAKIMLAGDVQQPQVNLFISLSPKKLWEYFPFRLSDLRASSAHSSLLPVVCL